MTSLAKPPTPEQAVDLPADPAAPINLVVRPLDLGTISPTTPIPKRHWLHAVGAAARNHFLAIIFLLLPILASIVYYTLLLSDQYVSETRFVIRTTLSSGLGGLNLMAQSQGLTRTEDDAHLVNEFLKSRDAVMLLAKEDGLLNALKRTEADLFYGFPSILSGSTNEELYQHFSQFISVEYASATGITTLKVRAFTPADSQRLSTALLRHAEQVVNQLNERAHKDTIRFATEIAKQAENRVIAAQSKLANFRNRTAVIDPSKQSDATLDLVETLSKERSSLETALREARTSTPESPRVAALENRINAIEQQIADYTASLAGGAKSMASRMAEFDRLELERQLASKSLGAALSTLESARQDAARQQLYLQRVVRPNIPDKSQYPQRLLSIIMACAFCLALYWIASSLADVIMDHDT